MHCALLQTTCLVLGTRYIIHARIVFQHDLYNLYPTPYIITGPVIVLSTLVMVVYKGKVEVVIVRNLTPYFSK